MRVGPGGHRREQRVQEVSTKVVPDAHTDDILKGGQVLSDCGISTAAGVAFCQRHGALGARLDPHGLIGDPTNFIQSPQRGPRCPASRRLNA